MSGPGETPVGRVTGRGIRVEIGTPAVRLGARWDNRACEIEPNRSRTGQGLPPLPATGRTLLDQLTGDGRLLDKVGGPTPAGVGGARTYSARIDNASTRVFCIAASAILEDQGARSPRRGRVNGS